MVNHLESFGCLTLPGFARQFSSSSRQEKPLFDRRKSEVVCSRLDKISGGGDRNMEEITATELKRRLDGGEDIQIVDVREPNEYAFARIPNSVHIPLGQVLNRMSEIDPSRETVVHCKLGGRSARAIEALTRAGFQGKLVNLAGGITAWSNDVDPSVPKY
jgi:rhodanese-related sulfurtransferase